MLYIWLFPLATVLTAILVWIIRRYALSANLLDIPNARSSHALPVPRGGGMGFVLVFIAGLIVANRLNLIDQGAVTAFLGSGILIALVGFIDDHHPVPAGYRLMTHFIAAVWGLYFIGGLPSFELHLGSTHSVYSDWLLQLIGIFYLVWLLNLFNFMDGIDGLAAIEAITVCIGGILLYYWQETGTGVAAMKWWMVALLAASVAGFLFWNFPPAKIFMGDVGSGFLGIILGLFSIQAAGFSSSFFWGWLILLGVFICDATLTLIRRFLNGEKLYEAHRIHAYQHAARTYHNHRPVSLAVAVINLCWLLPIAMMVGKGICNSAVGLILAYAPLIGLAIHFRAGVRKEP